MTALTSKHVSPKIVKQTSRNPVKFNTVLYQFPISHYCEKARWALDHKGIQYQVKNLLPGPHIKQVKKIASATELPVLKIQGDVIQGSDKIIDYLDIHFPESLLTPENSAEKREIEEWEAYADKNLGVAIRSIIYDAIIREPGTIIPMWTKSGPWYGPLFYKFFFSQVQRAVIKGMNVNEKTTRRAKSTIEKSFVDLNKEVSEKTFLVGDRLSRADLAVSALLSPLVLPKNSYLEKYLPYPDKILSYREQFIDQPLFRWVEKKYEQYR